MIAAIASRDSASVALVFARGSYDFGLLDARFAGSATLIVSANASGMDKDVIKEGSLVHIYPQRGFDHWYGLVTNEPVYNRQNQTYTVSALEVIGFLADILSVANFDPPGEPGADGWRHGF